MRLRFVQDASAQLAYGDGRIVSVSHRKGEEVEVADDLGRLFLSQGVAVALRKPQRAVRPKGETR